MSYTPFPFDPSWPTRPVERTEARARLKQLLAIKDARVSMMTTLLGLDGMKELCDGDMIYYPSYIQQLEAWVFSCIRGVKRGVIDMQPEGEPFELTKRYSAHELSPMAESICIGAGLFLAEAVMYNNQHYKWEVARAGQGCTLKISNALNKIQVTPWAVMFGVIADRLRNGTCCPALCVYAGYLAMPKLRKG